MSVAGNCLTTVNKLECLNTTSSLHLPPSLIVTMRTVYTFYLPSAFVSHVINIGNSSHALLNSSKPSSYTSGNKCIITCTSGLSIVMYLTTLLPGPREVLGLMFSLCTPPYCIFMAAILLSVSLVCMLELGNNNKIMCSLMLRNMRYIVDPCYCQLLVITMTKVNNIC